jgi:hypothetical protein
MRRGEQPPWIVPDEHTGIQWEFLPQRLGFGSGMTCWRGLEEWNTAGVSNRHRET